MQFLFDIQYYLYSYSSYNKDMKKLFLKLLQFIRFGIVGLINTGVSLLIYYVLVYFGIPYLISTITGYVISSIIGYILNRVWVFKAKNKVKESLIKYFFVYITALLLNVIFMYLFVDLISISDKIAPLLVLCITIPYNFTLSKFWTFKEKRKKNNESCVKQVR